MSSSTSHAVQKLSRTLRHASTERVVFGDVIYHPGGSCGPRIQGDYQLVAVVEGEARVRVEGSEIVIGSGEVGLFQPGRKEMFRFSPGRNTHHTWCSVHVAMVDSDLREACERVASVQPTSQRLVQLLELGLSSPRDVGTRAAGLLDSLGVAALHEFIYDANRQDDVHEPDALRRTLDWIGSNLAQPASLSVLAKAGGVSTAQLVKIFRRHIGTTPMRALWTARTEQGVRLLRETGLSVSEIAYHSGFATPFHFSRWVRQLHGKSPRAVRAEAWGGRK